MAGESSARPHPQQGPASYQVDGEDYPRVPFGAEADETGHALDESCECGAAHGQLHSPGCEVEECPLCQYPAFDCECAYGPLETDLHGA